MLLASLSEIALLIAEADDAPSGQVADSQHVSARGDAVEEAPDPFLAELPARPGEGGVCRLIELEAGVGPVHDAPVNCQGR